MALRTNAACYNDLTDECRLLQWPYGRMLPVAIALQTSTVHYNGPTDECRSLQMPYNKIPPVTTALHEGEGDQGKNTLAPPLHPLPYRQRPA